MKPVSQKICFNYGMSLTDMVTSCEFDWVDPFLFSSPVLIEGVGDVVMPCLHRLRHKHSLKSRYALKILDEIGFRPANPAEFLLHCANNKKNPRYSILSVFEIPVPGGIFNRTMQFSKQIWDTSGNSHVGRIMHLGYFFERQLENERYLVVPNKLSSIQHQSETIVTSF